MAGLSDFYRQLEAAGRLPSVYSGNWSMRAQSGDPFVEGFMDGRNIRNSVLAEKEAIQDRERAKQMMDQARNTWYQGDYTRGQIPDSPYPVTQPQMGDNPLGKPLGQVLYEGLSGAQNGAQASPAKTDYSFPARQGAEPMDTTFQNAMPTEQNGFHLGSYPQTEMYGDPKDWQRQMVRNAAGLNGEQKWFNPNGFGSAINKAQNTINQNFQNPSSDNTAALAGEGTGVSANDLTRPQTIDEYLGRRFNTPQFGADYGLQQWMRDDRAHGVTDPFVSLMRYQMFIDPIVQQARQDDLRNAFATYNNPNATPEERNNAIAKMEFYLKRPYMQEDRNWMNESRQMQRENHRANLNYRNAQANGLLGSGSGFVDRVRDLQGRIGYNAPDGTNCMRTMGIALSGTPYEGQINVDQAVSTAKELGDLHVSGDGYKPRPGDMAVVNGGNHVVMLTENGGTIQNGESHNGVYEDQRSPEQIFGKVNYWISSSRYAGGGSRRRGIGASSRTRLDSAYEKQLQKMQENYNKNVEGFRQNAIRLSELDNISEDNGEGKKKYEAQYKELVKNVMALCDAYKESGSKMDSTQFGIALYHKLNEDPTGLIPEQLAEAVAEAIATKRSGVNKKKLYNDILNEVYSKQETGDGNPQGDNGKGQPTDPVDDLSYEDRQGGVYNVGGVRMTESMYNKINNIKPYKETLKEDRMRFAQEQESAQNRAQSNQNEWEKMFDENEKYYGI